MCMDTKSILKPKNSNILNTPSQFLNKKNNLYSSIKPLISQSHYILYIQNLKIHTKTPTHPSTENFQQKKLWETPAAILKPTNPVWKASSEKIRSLPVSNKTTLWALL